MNAHEGGRKEVSIVTVEEGAVHVCVSGREQGGRITGDPYS